MIFIVHPDRTVTTIAETLHVGDTSADVTVLSPFSGVQNCMLKFLLPTGEEGTPQFLNYYGDGTDLGLGYEGSVYTMKIPAVMTKVAGAVQVQIIFTDTGAQQFASEIATFTVSGIEVLPFPDSEEQGEDFAAQLLAMQAVLAGTMEAAKVGDTVCKFVIASANTTITLKNLTGMYQIDWGDGTVDNELSHTYAEAGTYTCYITGVTAIGTEAFKAIGALKSIVIGDAVQSIGAQAFQNCTDLDYVTIGSGVTSIGNAAFSGSSVSTITIPDTVTEINANVFFNCASLQTAVIGNGVRGIGNYAFYGCSSLKQIIFKGTTPPTITSTTPFASANNCPLFVPYKCLAAYQSAAYYSSIASRIFVTDTQPMTGSVDPTTSTATDYVGKVYINTTTGAAFVCTVINSGVYTWQPIGSSFVTVDAALSGTSENPVQNKVVKDALDGKQPTLTFDDAPTAGSNNPVKSGGIKTALDGKQATLTFDSEPTANSTNPVTSGGVKTSLDLKANSADVYTKAQVDSKVSAVFRYKGTVLTVADLSNIQDPAVGDVYTVTDDGAEYVYTDMGTWQYLGVPVDLSGKLDKLTGTASKIRVYVANMDGTQGYVYATLDSNGTIVVRGNSGELKVPQTPTNDTDAASKKYVDDGLSGKQGTLTAGTGIDITNNVISSTASVTVDSALSGSSENPVQNKVVTKALAEVDLRKTMVCKFKTTSANTAITLQNLTGMYQIDWGDGTIDSNLTHTYAAAGTYTCYIHGITGIGASAFYIIPSLIAVSIPESVTSIGDYAFYACQGLKSIVIPDSVTSVGEKAFMACQSLISAKLGNGMTNTGTEMLRMSANLTELRSVEIPHSITTITSLFLANCSKLTSITIPSSVTAITGGQNFNNCSSLQKIVFESATPPTLNNANAFDNTNNCLIVVPKGAAAAYKAATNFTSYASRIVEMADSNDLAGKQDTLTAGTGISITSNVISATGGSTWNVADSGSGNYSVDITLSANKRYEVIALGYHPMGDFTPASTPAFIIDTATGYTATNPAYVEPAFDVSNAGAVCKVTPDMGEFTYCYFAWVYPANSDQGTSETSTSWRVKVLYREATTS